MSSEAVTRRLTMAGELRDLCLALMKAKRRHDERLVGEESGHTNRKDSIEIEQNYSSLTMEK